jgi:hypothetical protein
MARVDPARELLFLLRCRSLVARPDAHDPAAVVEHLGPDPASV